MKIGRLLVFFCVFILSIMSVSAVVQRIEANCSVADTTVTCGDTLTFTCTIVDYYTGVLGINDVKFKVGSIIYDAELVSGTMLNGVWNANVEVTDSLVSSSITSVSIEDSAGNVCSASLNKNSDGCLIQFGDKSFTASCTCTMTPTTVCNSDNTATITYVPSAGCSAEAYTVASICDYCDPDWIPSYTSCSVNVSAASLVGEFVGTALKSYSSGNPGCCAATGLNSDCKEPLDVNTNVACVLDYWSTQGKDAEGTSDTARYKQIFDPTGGCTASVSPELASNGLPIRPLVFDFDRDGETEVVVPTVAGFKTYDDDCSQEETTSVYSGGWEGGLSMTNFMAYSNSYIRDNYMMSEEYLSGSGGAFAGIDRKSVV